MIAVAIHQNTPNQISEQDIIAYLEKQKITYPFAIDQPGSAVYDQIPKERRATNGATYLIYDVKGTPAMYVIDKKGILRDSPTYQNVEEWIIRLLAEN